MILLQDLNQSIPITDNPLINWLAGVLIFLVLAIIIYLLLTIKKSISSLSETVSDLDKGMIKMETQLGQLIEDSKTQRDQISNNTADIGKLKGMVGRLEEWRKSVEEDLKKLNK